MLYETVLKYRQNRDEYFKQYTSIYDMIIRHLQYFGIYKIIWPCEIYQQNNKFNFNANMEKLSRIYNDFLVEKDDIGKVKFMDILLKDTVGVSNFIYDMKILGNIGEKYG
jgi:oligoribonuclease NrnB/cAMP/cGMP phosphodiesterase (DHH superfamily)